MDLTRLPDKRPRLKSLNDDILLAQEQHQEAIAAYLAPPTPQS